MPPNHRIYSDILSCDATGILDDDDDDDDGDDGDDDDVDGDDVMIC